MADPFCKICFQMNSWMIARDYLKTKWFFFYSEMAVRYLWG